MVLFLVVVGVSPGFDSLSKPIINIVCFFGCVVNLKTTIALRVCFLVVNLKIIALRDKI